MHTVRIWDLPTRLFHWSLAICVVALVVTGSVGGAWMEWHLRLGYTAFTLLLFRLVWGFVGGHWSRFGAFLYSPSSLVAHLRGRSPLVHTAGHSPLGALSVFALLLLLAVQVGTGLVSDDEIATFGPLVRLVSGDTVAAATGYHKEVGKLIVLVLVGLHVLAIIFYKLVKREALTKAMLTGDKQLPQGLTSARDTVATRLTALVVLAGCAGVVWWVVGLGATGF
ncbi:MAG: cytochrome b/b6 domain-containing protein [Hydrogenophaga sp.]|uniref:cytochrome b/b6 domain-containing protein n=1 Tax=Hydrogenophaga sp. TaxID=1904254 RepID=UPI001DED3577|nr:cytochrome b/b6 domain-containing protein [Hydrogenophaga sp.]MBX3608268.1 cytochrome b/b6 domain-containing protein [Hydrogenophaga sp.]